MAVVGHLAMRLCVYIYIYNTELFLLWSSFTVKPSCKFAHLKITLEYNIYLNFKTPKVAIREYIHKGCVVMSLMMDCMFSYLMESMCVHMLVCICKYVCAYICIKFVLSIHV